MIEAELARANGGLSVRFSDYTLSVDDTLARAHRGLDEYAGRPILLGIRPEDIADASLDSDAPLDRRLEIATCDYTEPLGAEVLVYFTIEAKGVVTDREAESVPILRAAGAEAESRVVARVDPRTRIVEGSSMVLAVDTSRLYFFDPETGDAI
jgi:multiple sugar transport system ATP-binding protein